VQKSGRKELIVLGKMVKKARKEKRLSQTELAAKIDLDTRTIQRIERGESNITFTNFCALIEVLNISPSDVWNP
jgi:transcriptional regulator with XRE-family HTH domain